jgi:glycogen debranching enzyme
MDQVWSWDHCFNAMALARGNPDLAWDQLMIMADRQDSFGAYPDAVNDEGEHFNYSKPPVHGWTLQYMMKQKPAFFTRERVAEAYDTLERWTNWWTTHRTWPGDAIPYYLHGNDSGWDNSTIFDHGCPVVSPDLPASLAIQMETLADLATRLGKKTDAARWRKQSKDLIDNMMKILWQDGIFVGMRRPDGFAVRCDSLIRCIPIVMGKRLPKDIRHALVDQVRTFLTPHGPATERTASQHYRPDGYWRGPIWAPSTLMIVSGLADAGEKKLARDIAERFCVMCGHSGFAENFDALTGAGLRDRAYTWTASAFLVLASDYL